MVTSHASSYSLGIQFISNISSYVIKTSSGMIHSSIKYIHSQMTPDRVLQISLLALSGLGLGASIYNRSITPGVIFSGILILQIVLLVETHDHFFITQKCKDLTQELEEKKGLSEQLILCTSKIKELVSSLAIESTEKLVLAEKLESYSAYIQDLVQKLDCLQGKMAIFEETRMDVTKIVDLLFQAKMENESLKKSLESKMESFEGHADRLMSSAERIESGLGKVDNSFDMMQDTAEKISLLSTKLDDLLKRATTS